MSEEARKITAADLKAAKWSPGRFASGPAFHMRDYFCDDFPRVTFRVINRAGEPERQTMLVDGKDVGGSEAAAAILSEAHHDEA